MPINWQIIPPDPNAPPSSGAPKKPVAKNTYAGDPALNLIQASNLQDLGIARAQADERRKNLLLQYGSPELATSMYGASDPIVGAVGANPFSALALGKQNYDKTLWQTDQDLNKANLWHGGTRVKTLGDLAKNYQQQQYQMGTATQADMQMISDFLLQAEKAARDRQLMGEIDAFNRGVQGVIPQ